MAKKKITDIVRQLAGDFLMENGYELYNCEFVKEGRDWFLRVFIDIIPACTGQSQISPDSEACAENEDRASRYIGTEDCEKVSRFLSARLDETDPIEQNYYLEVSSPGMDRPLITPEHYRRYLNHEIDIRLYKAINGSKEIHGLLTEFISESEEEFTAVITISDGTAYRLKLSEIAKANLAVVF